MKVTLIACVGLSACAAAPYQGVPEGTPPNQAAKVIANDPGFVRRMNGIVSIACVDGKWFKDMVGGFASTNEATVSVGVHYIGAYWEYDDGIQKRWQYQPFWVDAQGGHTYVVGSEPRGAGVTFWLQDQATREHVGGMPGSEPNPAGKGKRCISGEPSD